MHDARCAALGTAHGTRVDPQHTALTQIAGLCVQDNQACHRRLEDDAPGDPELGCEVVGAGGKDDVGDGGVGECSEQAGDGAHRCLQLTTVALHRLHGGQPGNVAGLGGCTHVIQLGRRGDAAHDRPGAHDGCGMRELSPIMLAVQEGSSKLRRRRSRTRQRAESAVVGRGRERRRRHYGQRRRHRRMCRGRHGDDPVQESSSHRSTL